MLDSIVTLNACPARALIAGCFLSDETPGGGCRNDALSARENELARLRRIGLPIILKKSPNATKVLGTPRALIVFATYVTRASEGLLRNDASLVLRNTKRLAIQTKGQNIRTYAKCAATRLALEERHNMHAPPLAGLFGQAAESL